MSSPLRFKFNPAAGWLYVFHDTPRVEAAGDALVLFVPPGLTHLYRPFYPESVHIIENEKFPA